MTFSVKDDSTLPAAGLHHDFSFQTTRLELVEIAKTFPAFADFAGNIAILTLDDPASSANVMHSVLQQELDLRADQLQEIAQASEIDAAVCGLWVVTAKPKIFIAGADIKSIAATAHYGHDQIVQFCQRGDRLYERYANLPFPTFALIQGACLGGGLEFAMALDWRIAADDRSTLIGLPEVQLGLIPGWAATARVARQCSVETAMLRIGSGENFSAAVALEIGMVDQVVPADQMKATALKTLRQTEVSVFFSRRQQLQGPASCLFESEISRSPESKTPVTAEAVQALAVRTISMIEDKFPGLHPRAPRLVVDLIRRSALLSKSEAAALEAETMAQVYASSSGQSLVNAFLLNDRARRAPGLPPPPDAFPKIKTIGIVGMGVMGTSLTSLLQNSPWQLIVFDQDKKRQEGLRVEFGGQSRVIVVDSITGLSDCDVVLENVFENLEVKRQLLEALESIVSPDTHLLTNTSVIPINKLQFSLQYPERFGGLHFFNPIAETKLAEIAKHPTMSPTTQWVAHLIAKQVGKLSIVVQDGPGLVVNRLLMAMLNEAQHLLAEGYSIEAIDNAATEFGWRLGPFQILDVIGLSTAFDAGRQVGAELPGCVDAPPFLLPQIKAGRQGVKSGAGFYRYDAHGNRQNDDAVEAGLDAYRKSNHPDPADRLSSAQIADRLTAPMVWQAAEILRSGQVELAQDIDLCCLFALGFPPHRGGLLFWADHFPLGRLVEQTQRSLQASKTPDRLSPPKSLQNHLSQGQRFYGKQ